MWRLIIENSSLWALRELEKNSNSFSREGKASLSSLLSLLSLSSLFSLSLSSLSRSIRMRAAALGGDYSAGLSHFGRRSSQTLSYYKHTQTHLRFSARSSLSPSLPLFRTRLDPSAEHQELHRRPQQHLCVCVWVLLRVHRMKLRKNQFQPPLATRDFTYMEAVAQEESLCCRC